MLHYLLVAIGGALGAMLRYWVYNATPFQDQRVPLATVVVNVCGSLLIGVLWVLLVEKSALGPQWRSLLMVGFLGALTTYSTYSLEALLLLEQGQVGMALSYLVGTLLLCLMAAWIGVALSRLVL